VDLVVDSKIKLQDVEIRVLHIAFEARTNEHNSSTE
jgi:hypothetical protein